MNNEFGEKVKLYRNVLADESFFDDMNVVGDDSIIKGSKFGEHCIIERRSVVINSIMGNYTYCGYNSNI